MKKILYTAVICAIAMSTIGSRAMASNFVPYISAKGAVGFSSSDNYYPTPFGFGFSGAVGAIYESEEAKVRGELEFSNFSYQKDENEDDFPFEKYESSYKLDTNTYMANVYVHLFRKNKVELYIGGGMGMATFKEDFSDNQYFYGTDLNIPSESHREISSFAYNVSLGFSFGLTDGLDGDTGIRCTHFVTSNRIITCDANIGLRYTF